ncbi:MAG TPA: M14 family zinc carboxypeptidase [Verrucomicrobiae bacterium]
MKHTLTLALLTLCFQLTAAAEVKVRTDFEGGSAHIESIDQTNKVIRFTPGGDPARGWACWWYLRVDGIAKGDTWTFDLAASPKPTRNDGKLQPNPLAASWAMADRATFSTDEKTWTHTAPGKRVDKRIHYTVTGTGGPLWLAWGPPFTPRDTDKLLTEAKAKLPTAEIFTLATTREKRPVKALRINESKNPQAPVIWAHARQHAWEAGASWVARGLTEWLVSDDADARWLRANAEIILIPIMDVDNVATGNGGKEADPRDHNRDWTEQPVYPEVAAAQKRLLAYVKENRLSLFLDLHNPAPGDRQPFFFVGPEEDLTPQAKENRAKFLAAAMTHINGPLPVEKKTRTTGASYHPLVKQISGMWVTANGNPHTVAACLETSWNTPHSTTEGYLTVGKQLGEAVTAYVRQQK